MATIDNVIYVLRLTGPATQRGLGWAVGPSNPPGQPHDQVYSSEDGSLQATFHWIVNPNNPQVGVDTSENVTANLAGGTWKHFKIYNNETTGYWFITDLQRLIDAARARGFVAFANFLETSQAIPRVGEQIPGT